MTGTERFDPLAEAAERVPADRALSDDGRSWSFAEWSAEVEPWAAALSAAGAGPGERVALLADPSGVGLRALHAVLRTGAAVAPLGTGLTSPELSAALNCIRPALLVAEERYLERGREAWTADTAPALISVGQGGIVERVRGRPGSPDALGGPPGVAVLLTSGTSGAPRGVILSASGVRSGASASAARLGLGPADRWLASLSLAHVGGLVLVLRAALLGSAVVACRRFEADRFIRDAGDSFTHASLVPTQLARVLAEAPPDERMAGLGAVLVGGAAASAELVSEASRRGVPVALTYGLTEATSQVATATPAESSAHPERVGRPLEGVELELSSEAEILVRGETVAAGHLLPTPDGALEVRALVDERGWLHTGDRGELDEHGTLRVIGRLAERIVTGGVNVDPAEVEVALVRHPGVRGAVVVGIPDPEWGERVVAAVVPTGPGSLPGPVELTSFLRSSLGGPKRPKAYVEVQELPLNLNGKLDRSAVRALFVAD